MSVSDNVNRVGTAVGAATGITKGIGFVKDAGGIGAAAGKIGHTAMSIGHALPKAASAARDVLKLATAAV